MKVESRGGLGWQEGRGTCVAWATLVYKCLVPSQPASQPASPWEMSLEDASGNPESLLLHTREGGAGSMLDFSPLSEGPLL